jgi:hypothetical protein
MSSINTQTAILPGGEFELQPRSNSYPSSSNYSRSTPADTIERPRSDTALRNGWSATSATSDNGPHPGVQVIIPEAAFPGPVRDSFIMAPIVEEAPAFEPNREVVRTRRQLVWRWCKSHPLWAVFFALNILVPLGWLLVGVPIIFSIATSNNLEENSHNVGWGR